MATQIINYKCDACDNGVVIVKERKTKDFITLTVDDCNSCKKPFGVMRVSKLEKVTNP